MAAEIENSDSLDAVTLLQRVVTGNMRLLLGMVRANHPWRLITRLYRAAIGALGVAAFAVVTSDVWRIAATLDPLRLAIACLATIATAVATLIAVHDLWERARDRRVREQAIMFNLVTVITITIGILALYAVVSVLSLAAATLLIDPSVMTGQINAHSKGVTIEHRKPRGWTFVSAGSSFQCPIKGLASRVARGLGVCFEAMALRPASGTA